jgi:hypothetical protein
MIMKGDDGRVVALEICRAGLEFYTSSIGWLFCEKTIVD